jgi:TorA maturation chaperone TorD
MLSDDCLRAAARADLCRLLAACYYEPGRELAEEKVFDAMANTADLIDPELAAAARRLGAAYAATELQDLLVDYTRLFLGPVQALAKPYGSVWLDTRQELMQDSTVALLELYAEAGFEMADDFRDLPDHIAAELEFLYLLLYREASARTQSDAAALAESAALRGRLLGEHLGRWVSSFVAAIRDGAQTDFYRELGTLTERFVALDAGARDGGVVEAQAAAPVVERTSGA